MNHVLDNPAWSALISGNKSFVNGNDTVKYFAREVSPFVALKENSAENFLILYNLIESDRTVLLISPAQIELPNQWNLLQCISGLQMVYEGDILPFETVPELVPLTDAHIPQMLALIKLTNPGPFAERTIDFGHYYGIFDSGKLVAMTGQRLHAFEYAEVSAVCTHPDHLGKGYARRLIINQINRIKAAGETPFLHVRHDNDRAVKVYKDLGFKKRTAIYYYVMKKAEGK